MTTLTLQYQYPEGSSRSRRATPRAFKRQIQPAFEEVHEIDRWCDPSQIFGQLAADSSVVNASMGNSPCHAQYEFETAANTWSPLFSSTMGGNTGLHWRAAADPRQILNTACVQTSLANEADECSKLLLHALLASSPVSIGRSHSLLQAFRKSILGAAGFEREKALVAISDRIEHLRSSAAEEQIDVNASSLQDLRTFIEELPFSAAPLVFLLDGGTFRLVWRGDKEQIALEFLGNKTIRYVFFAARPQPVSEAKSAGIDDALHIVEQIKAVGLSHLIGHVG